MLMTSEQIRPPRLWYRQLYSSPSDDIAVVHSGVNGLILVVDTIGDGHIETYGGDKPGIAIQFPIADNAIPFIRFCILEPANPRS